MLVEDTEEVMEIVKGEASLALMDALTASESTASKSSTALSASTINSFDPSEILLSQPMYSPTN